MSLQRRVNLKRGLTHNFGKYRLLYQSLWHSVLQHIIVQKSPGVKNPIKFYLTKAPPAPKCYSFPLLAMSPVTFPGALVSCGTQFGTCWFTEKYIGLKDK